MPARLLAFACWPGGCLLQDDLEVAVDFFDYFTAVEPLLVGDESLLAASAWNDLGACRPANTMLAQHL